MSGIDLSDFDYVFNEFGQLQDFMSSVEQGDGTAVGLQFLNRDSSPQPAGSSGQSQGQYTNAPYGNGNAISTSVTQSSAQVEIQAAQQPATLGTFMAMPSFQQPQQQFGQIAPQQYIAAPQPFLSNGTHIQQQIPSIQVPMVGPMQPGQMIPGPVMLPQMPGYGPVPGQWAQIQPLSAPLELQQQTSGGMAPLQAPGQLQSAGEGTSGAPITFAAPAEDCKKTSTRRAQKDQKLQNHSWVEKNRRDRINSLIDELRELVPATGEFSEASEKNRFKSSIGLYDKNGQDTRPKHIVLRDTVDMVRSLLEKARLGPVKDEPRTSDPVARAPATSTEEYSAERGGSRADADSGILQGSARAILDRDYSSGHQAGEEQPQPYQLQQQQAPQQQQHPAASPSASFQKSTEHGPELPFISVEENAGAMFVRVQCSDRKGLLSDIIEALKVFPLEIKTAAITTGTDSTVHDVFEVRREDASPLTTADIQQHLLQLLMATRSGDKRRRVRDDKVEAEVAT